MKPLRELLALAVLSAPGLALAADWPQLQCNAAHTGYTEDQPSPPYRLLWRRDLKEPMATEEITATLAAFYENANFVEVLNGTPRIKDVVGSNYAHIGAVTEGSSIAVFTAIDNLMKGAAGGSVQWMNRLLGLDETAGLTTPGPGWV